jgi:hypothetical protein
MKSPVAENTAQVMLRCSLFVWMNELENGFSNQQVGLRTKKTL